MPRYLGSQAFGFRCMNYLGMSPCKNNWGLDDSPRPIDQPLYLIEMKFLLWVGYKKVDRKPKQGKNVDVLRTFKA